MESARELATAYYFVGNIDAAELNYRKAFTLAPDQAENNYNLAVVLLRQDTPDEAFEYAVRAVQLNPQSPKALFVLGEVSEKLGELDSAMIAYQNAVKLDPDYLKARINLGNLYDENGMYDEALPHLVAAYRIDQDSLEVNNNLGNVYLHKKLYRDAIQHYQKAIVQKPDATLMRYHLSIAYIETDQFVLAIDTLLELLKINSEYWDAYYQLGKIHYGEGNTDEAIQTFRNLLLNNPDYEHREEIEKLIGN
jgi:tetratricopeptide (TPR) repeat protein